MSLRSKPAPTVITVRPTHIRAGVPSHTPTDDFHHRFRRPIIATATTTLCTWLAYIITSQFSMRVAFYVAMMGMCATGIILYRELFRTGLARNRIVGALIVLITLPLPAVFTFSPLSALGLNPNVFAAVSLGLAIGWMAHVLNIFNAGEPPCSLDA